MDALWWGSRGYHAGTQATGVALRAELDQARADAQRLRRARVAAMDAVAAGGEHSDALDDLVDAVMIACWRLDPEYGGG